MMTITAAALQSVAEDLTRAAYDGEMADYLPLVDAEIERQPAGAYVLRIPTCGTFVRLMVKKDGCGYLRGPSRFSGPPGINLPEAVAAEIWRIADSLRD